MFDKYVNGEYKILANGVEHWVKISGIEHESIPIVVLHGGPGGNNYVYENTIGKKIENYATIIYYEQRGCGRSEEPHSNDDYSIDLLTGDLLVIINELGIDKVNILGYSFGGQLAMEFTLRYSEKVHKLILQSPSVSPYERLAYTQVQGFRQIVSGGEKVIVEKIAKSKSTIEEKLDKIWDIVHIDTVDKLLFYNTDNAKDMRHLWAKFGYENTGDMANALNKETRKIELLDNIKNIKNKTLILAGLYDRNVGLDLLRDIHSKIENSKFIIFDKSAHFPDLEEPIKYAKAIHNFLFEIEYSVV